MNYRSVQLYLLLFVSILLSISLTGLVHTNASASGLYAQRSVLTFESLKPVPVGQYPAIQVWLADKTGAPLEDMPLAFYLNDELARRARTDKKGGALIYLSPDLAPGNYFVRVVFAGTEEYLPVTIIRTLIIRPSELTIQTIPPLPGMEFHLNGKSFTADETGVAKLKVDKPGDYRLETIIPAEREDYKVHFDRWGDEAFEAQRTVSIKDDVYLEAGFALFYTASQTFYDLEGNRVPDERISEITLKSSFGAYYTYRNGKPRLYQQNRIARRKTGLEATPVQYSVERVIMDGTNVVNRAQQRYYLSPDDVWPVELLLYYAQVRTRDAVLGFSVGNGVTVEYPNGRIDFIPFDGQEVVTIGPLARGLYKMQVTGVRGLVPLTPVALSQDQEVELKVLTSLDIGLGIALGALIGFGLLFYGRPRLLLLPAAGMQLVRRLKNWQTITRYY